jgi:DNA excision repair protein ERCC-4
VARRSYLGPRPPGLAVILTDPDEGAEPVLFDRRAIALRALRSVANGSQPVDGLTGEVPEAEADQGSD